MINPTECVARILINDPALAEPLFDFMVWVEGQSNLKDDSDYDEAKNFVYMKLDRAREARDIYAKTRAA